MTLIMIVWCKLHDKLMFTEVAYQSACEFESSSITSNSMISLQANAKVIDNE